MAETTTESPDAPTGAEPAGGVQLEGGTYEILRSRLSAHAKDLRSRMEQLNAQRKRVFGSIDTKLLSSQQIVTANNCLPRDMIPVGDRAIFGYNVFIGLRSETSLADVFGVYRWKGGSLEPDSLDFIRDEAFETDFHNLYKYYRGTFFAKFAIIGPHLFMVFQVGKDVADIKTFKWLIQDDRLKYCDNRSDHEYLLPPQHGFEWTPVTRDMHCSGRFPHVSIEDRIFVETVGGDLTIKIEDNTESGEGIFREAVENPDQTLDDARILYSIVGNLILLKILPYKEQAWRYIAYCEKTHQAHRLDSMADCCVLLPDDHGVVFPRGAYLQTGRLRQFDSDLSGMVFEKCIPAPNGEDFLYLFYNRAQAMYVLMSYNLIEQELQTPLVCNGFSLFEDGTLICFRNDSSAQKHHTVQIWQTPFTNPDCGVSVQADSDLYKIGNKSIVRCLAECTEVLMLAGQGDSYANLYVDIARLCQNIRDAYFWLANPDTCDLAAPLGEIKAAATAAIEEFDKVVRTRTSTRQQAQEVAQKVGSIIASINYYDLRDIGTFVRLLGDLRAARGEVVSLKDLRYADLDQVARLEQQVVEHSDKLSGLCVEFLLKDESLAPYHAHVAELSKAVERLVTVAQGREHGHLVDKTGIELEMLIQVVSNLKIADATATTAIIDRISLVYSQLNQVKAALRNCIAQKAQVENLGEFNAQMKLIDQSVINYLDVCDQPEKCDEYLTKVLVQIEGLEGRFADVDEFIAKLGVKREELYNAFEGRKVQLVEARNKRASAVFAAAGRILKGIRNRAGSLGSINEINGYFASDLMIERVRATIQQLRELGDSVKAEDVTSQLKTIQQEATRQLKDKQALYEDGQSVIRLGEHRFSVNRQELELTLVQRDGAMFLHLTGTGFFEPVADQRILDLRDVWDIDTLSESAAVYRGQYLAYLMFRQMDASARDIVHRQTHEELCCGVQEFMGPRYAEGYVKGVHDHDAAVFLKALVGLHDSIGLLRYSSPARALATVCWHMGGGDEASGGQAVVEGLSRTLQQVAARIRGVAPAAELFAGSAPAATYLVELTAAIADFVRSTGLFSQELVDEAAEYLFEQLAAGGQFIVSRKADELARGFLRHLEANRFDQRLADSTRALSDDSVGWYRVAIDWVGAYLSQHAAPDDGQYCQEVAAVLLTGLDRGRPKVDADLTTRLSGLKGSHATISNGRCELDYCRFMSLLRSHQAAVVPKVLEYQRLKKDLVETAATAMRLEEFQAKVLTTFVRNKLIDKVYLPLVGDNLARQIGTAGADKRTDRQGMLLLISPPGYGKTTLMEYVANRLGLIFVKVNGPSIGHRVTSLDPAEAPNAAAREEIQKLNLAFEMGDNVMIYVDDIQHTSAELLQKFISLCDAQRRIEGVYKGRTRTYDLRGKRVCVVMAGNPYTENGERFKIPDMLTNRADTYNIGDIVGDNYNEFVTSYIENCLTANPLLSRLAARSQHDVYELLKLAESSDARHDSLQLEGSYSVEEINEYVGVLRKLLVVRDVVLKVNTQYIRSAGQAAEYRTEPPFLLQGSYRNMNRIAGRVLPVMNDDELWTLIMSSYDQDAQTLTSSAEANLLKFKELLGRLTAGEQARWDEIKKTFGRNKLLGPAQNDDKIGTVIRQLNAFGASLDSIRDVLGDAASAARTEAKLSQSASPQAAEALSAGMGRFARELEAIRTVMADGVKSLAHRKDGDSSEAALTGKAVLERLGEIVQALKAPGRQSPDGPQPAQGVQALTSVLEEQFQMMETWLAPVARSEQGRQEYVQQLIGRFESMVEGYSRLIGVLRQKHDGGGADA